MLLPVVLPSRAGQWRFLRQGHLAVRRQIRCCHFPGLTVRLNQAHELGQEVFVVGPDALQHLTAQRPLRIVEGRSAALLKQFGELRAMSIAVSRRSV